MGEENRSRKYHLVILTCASLILVIGAIYQNQFRHKSVDGDVSALETLKKEIGRLRQEIKQNELISIEKLVAQAVNNVQRNIVAIKPINSGDTNYPQLFYDQSSLDSERGNNQPIFEKSYSGLLLDGQYILTTDNVIGSNGSNREFNITFEFASNQIADLISYDRSERIALLKLRQEFTDRGKLVLVDESLDQPGVWVISIGRRASKKKNISLKLLSTIKQDLKGHRYLILDPPATEESDGSVIIDLQGKLAGINLVQPGNTWTLPIRRALAVIETLKTEGDRPNLAKVGIKVQEMDERLKTYFAAEQGALITDVVADSPAQIAGLKPMDIILQFNNKPIVSAQALMSDISHSTTLSDISLLVRRGSKEQEFLLKVVPATEPYAMFTREFSELEMRLGLIFSQRVNDGLRIDSLRTASAAERFGLHKDDLILQINGSPVKNYQDFLRREQGIDIIQNQLWQVQRQNENFFIVINGQKE